METSCKKMENVKNIFEVLIESTYNELEKNDKIKEKSSKDLNNDKAIKKLESLNQELKENIKNLENKLNEEKNNNKKLKQSIKDLNKIIKEKENIINDEKKKYEKLNKKLKELEQICNKNTNLKIVLEIMEDLKEKENEIKELKNKLSFELSKNENLISVNFISFKEDIVCSVICKNTDDFLSVENLFYDKCPQYKDLKKQFIINGNKINENKSLEENKIYDNSLIVIQLN